MNFDLSLLNKFEGQKLNEFLEAFIPDYNQQLLDSRKSGEVGKKVIRRVLNQFLQELDFEQPDNLNAFESIDRAFFFFLFYQDQDTYYHKKIKNRNLNIDYVWSSLEEDNNWKKYLDKHMVDFSANDEVVSIRKDYENLLILFNCGTYTTTKRKEEKPFLVSCRLNFKNNILSIGIKDSIFSKISDEDKDVYGRKRTELIAFVINKITSMNLKLSFESYAEGAVEDALYQLFIDQSNQAEALIKESFENEDEDQRSVIQFKEIAEEFLREKFGLKRPQEFVQKALSMKYQDQATQMPISKFANNGGYIFGFSFVEKQITRSDNKSDKKKPIYSSKLYWNLKDIIDEYPNISQLSMFWKFNKINSDTNIVDSDTNDLTFVELDYKCSNNDLVLHYYVKSNQLSIFEADSLDRKRREDYALRQINKYLSAKRVSKN